MRCTSLTIAPGQVACRRRSSYQLQKWIDKRKGHREEFMIHVISLRKDIRATTDIDSHEQEIIESWGRATVFCDLYNSTHAVFYRASWHESKESENLLIECWNYLDWQFCWLKALHFSTVIPYSRNRFYCMNLQKKITTKIR